MFDEFETAVNNMIGLTCWSAQISGVGSLLSLQIGDKIRRDKPMVHPDFKLTEEERFFRGTYILYVEDCPWRLESDESVLTTWLDDSSPRGQLALHIASLAGQTITHAEITRPGLDLCIRFDSGVTLRIFPDQIDPDEGDNYALSLVDQTFVVAAQSTLYIDEA
jgi:hypothetical protein